MKQIFKAKECIASFNSFRANNNVVSKVQLKKALKESNIPFSDPFILELQRFSIIKREHDKYVFLELAGPIHYTLLQNVYNAYYAKVARYNRISRARRKRKKNKSDIQEAIKVLKEYGYEIFMPVGTQYTKLL